MLRFLLPPQRLSYAKEQSDATRNLDGTQKESMKEQRKRQRATATGKEASRPSAYDTIDPKEALANCNHAMWP